MKVRPKKLTQKERIRTLDALYTAAGSVHGREAVKLFLRDLLTESERIMLGRRVLVARQLLRGASYEDIRKSVGAGPNTVSKIERWLHDQFPGYEQAIAGLEDEFDRRNEKKLYAQSALYRLKKKYPLHFLLFPTPKLKKNPQDEW